MIKELSLDQVNNAWIAKGQTVSDLDNKLTAMAVDDSFNADDFTAAKAKRDTAVAQRDALKGQLEEMQAVQVAATVGNGEIVELTNNEEEVKNAFIKDFKGMITGDPKIVNLVTSSTDEDGNKIGLTIPTDIQTTINLLKRQYQSLEQFVNVESTNQPNGSRVYEKWSDIKPLADLDDETATIGDNDDPALKMIKYLIHRYAGITTITNTLLKDTAENLLAWLSQWIAKKVVVTRNTKIIEAFDTAKKVTIAKYDDIIDLTLVELDPAINASASIITNQTSFAALKKIKNAMGGYLLHRDPTTEQGYDIEGKTITVIADKWLPNDTGSKFKLYYGDGHQFATLFDRENMSLLSTNIGGGAFENDSTKIRVIDRFDVQVTDNEAMVKVVFDAIEDQPALIVSK